jgi:hypothetical protein
MEKIIDIVFPDLDDKNVTIKLDDFRSGLRPKVEFLYSILSQFLMQPYVEQD